MVCVWPQLKKNPTVGRIAETILKGDCHISSVIEGKGEFPQWKRQSHSPCLDVAFLERPQIPEALGLLKGGKLAQR
jgi:hypothetical protein